MKKILVCVLSLLMLISLVACGKDAAKDVDLQKIYDSYQEYLPDMMVLDDDTMFNFVGVNPEDCAQVIVAVCAAGVQEDEVWLIRAKDQAALDRLLALAQTRQNNKEQETESYLPDQYTVVKESKTLTQGLYLAYLVSPHVQELQTAFENAVK